MNAGAILLVDDNAATRKMLRVALLAEGYSVIEAEDGASALRRAADDRPSLILLDCRLPDLSGFEVARTIRATLPEIPIIALTGSVEPDEAELLTAGFSDVLLKPIDPVRLTEIAARHAGVPPQKTPDIGSLVLVIDDDATQRKLARLALITAGYRVVAAADGATGLELARKQRPDIILSDVLMPDMDGFRVCEAVRADPELANVPVVLVSAHYLEEQDSALAARLGASRFVSRMSGYEEVVRTLSEALHAPIPEPDESWTGDLQDEYVRRVSRQLERHAELNAALARRATLQATALSVLDSISDALARQLDPEHALGETLAQCLDAAGLFVGAILLRDAEGRFVLKTNVGSPSRAVWSGHTELFERALAYGSLVLPSPALGYAGEAMLRSLGVAAAILVAIVARDEPLGVLVLASDRPDFAGTGDASFMRAARSVSMQLGQALALKRTFASLSEAEQRYAALLDNAYDAISVLSPDGVLLEVNRRAVEMFGIPREKMIGQHIRELAPESIARSGGAIEVTPIRRRDGSTIYVEFSSSVVEVGGERLVFAVGRDVTERVRLEEQLRQAQKMEAIGRLAGGVAHDFNNILSVIISYGEMVLSDLNPLDPLRADIEEIRDAGKRAADLTKQLLLFSRRQVLAPRILDLNQLLSGGETMLRRMLGEDIELVSSLDPALERVLADWSSLEQLVMNLAVNARDAMPTGGKLTIETANVGFDAEQVRGHLGAKPGRYVMVAVGDTGSGMDEATQARMFEPFFTTKETGKGTGLGLSTVFGIVQQSSGFIACASEVGVGTSFRIYLPVAKADVQEVEAPPVGPTARRGSETILLVEDEDQVRMVVRGILRRFGYQVIDARNAGEALLLSEKHTGSIHLLITDVVMPNMSGPQLAQRLAITRPEMKLLCMSGYTDDAAVRHGIVQSEIPFLQKPITVDALTRKVREVLEA